MTVEPQTKRQKRVPYTYPSQKRTISIYSVASKHPLNVKPSGNSLLLGTNPELLQQKQNSLGKLHVLPDELIMEIISYVPDVESLLNLSHTSRVLYAFLYDEETWKKVYMRNIQHYDALPWLGSWRNTVLNIRGENDVAVQMPENLVCSDLLYRPFQCSQIDYTKLFARIIKEEETYHRDAILGQLGSLPHGRIQRIKESEMSLDEFNTTYHDTPFILVNNDDDGPGRWPRWDFDTLVSRFPEITFTQESVRWKLGKYAQYLHNNKDESPLYLFDCKSDAMSVLRKEYDPPAIFQEDLFTVFNNNNKADDDDDGSRYNCRPDHAWIIIGLARSGSTFHKDPNSTSAWNAAIVGRKIWIMLPPHVTPPGVGTDDEESEVTSPVSVAEWVLSGFFNDATKIEECMIGVTFPGECMHVPSGWWHTVINIDDSIAITQNFVPCSKLAQVLNFLKNKPDQISGFRLKEIKQCLDVIVKESGDVVLKEFLDACEKLGKDDLDEDCGELAHLPRTPVFEVFKQLLVNNGKQELLNDALEKLEKIELKNYEIETGKSKAWCSLTETNTTSGGFTFGFDESDDE
ncbi:hypothetical protein Cantr_09228 [Candida viswanathii]|uniref:F-box protein n=1 Tax=Candida viswanathii TaxID=5486 RepID=A0A367YA59_9ASCO|nr:hypothetical protein Cantr_09228 [Candida viswanathii]